MLKIECPEISTSEVFDICVKDMRPIELRNRLIAAKDDIVAVEQKYLPSAQKAQLHKFPQTDSIGNGCVNRKDIIKIYNRLAHKDSPGRPTYNALRSAAPNDKCPLCGIGQVSTLDHHLPKSKFPALAVTPTNLVPACPWCQANKGEFYPYTAGEQMIHPYFDDFTHERWLYASVTETQPAAFSFKVSPPKSMPLISSQRLKHHFEKLSLNKLFAANAADELVNIRAALHEILIAGDASDVQSHIKLQAYSREEASKNSWQTAMYRAAEKSQWFCSGGFA